MPMDYEVHLGNLRDSVMFFYETPFSVGIGPPLRVHIHAPRFYRPYDRNSIHVEGDDTDTDSDSDSDSENDNNNTNDMPVPLHDVLIGSKYDDHVLFTYKNRVFGRRYHRIYVYGPRILHPSSKNDIRILGEHQQNNYDVMYYDDHL